jgi:hypothetical protein
MFSSVRRRLTYANVMVTFALVFAMSGGAYAAGKYLITSTKQISPKVLKSLVGKTGKAGANGAQGPAGPAGSQGPTGAKGETGAQGVAGKEGIQGKPGAPGEPGKQGEQGPPGTTGFTETLPPGKTETGGWVLSPSAEGIALVPISFNIPLEHELEEQDVHYVGENGNGTTCPGTLADSTAEPGNLCVYQSQLFVNLLFTAIDKYSSKPGASKVGAFLEFEAEASAPRIGGGTWAVTAGPAA